MVIVETDRITVCYPRRGVKWTVQGSKHVMREMRMVVGHERSVLVRMSSSEHGPFRRMAWKSCQVMGYT